MDVMMLDLFRIIIQIILCIYTISSCIKDTKKKETIIFFILYCSITGFFNISFRYTSISNIVEHVINFICIYVIFHTNKNDAILCESIYYIINNIFVLLTLIIIHLYVKNLIFIEDKLLIYLNPFIILYLAFVSIYVCGIKTIKRMYDFFHFDNQIGKAIVIFSFITDFVTSFYRSQIFDKNIVFQQFLIILIQIFFFIVMICSFKIYRTLTINYQLITKLDEKNKELRIVKNNYADILIYIRSLYNIGSIDKIGDVLKSIIDGQQLMIRNNTCYSNNSIISIIINRLESNGIKASIHEESDLSLCKMNELELYQVINNIVNNAIRVLENQTDKIVNIKIKKYLDNLITEIENNGPKIDEELKKKIFQTGFTTKKNEDCSHGYGLSIVKELIENNHGSIEVESTDFFTTFRISLPCK